MVTQSNEQSICPHCDGSGDEDVSGFGDLERCDMCGGSGRVAKQASRQQISEGAPELPNLPNLLLLNIRGGSISRNLAELEAIFQSYGAAREAHGRKKGLEEAAKACWSIGDGPENGCCPTYWDQAQEACEKAIKELT